MESDDECPDLIDMSNNDTHKNSEDRAKVPVTIITGHLGSGKTTLLNYILNEQHNKKVVVICIQSKTAYSKTFEIKLTLHAE